MTPLRDNHDHAADQGAPCQDPCRIRVRFADPPLELNYQDDRGVAQRFAAAAAAAGVEVTIDHHLQYGLPALPCRRLWT
ncbi:hypothetical protein [Nocardia cyriacigeorgica]|uniref:hypothetical protein n=1 Tax=Nocardia cyriacigeorgica TaxID=135487 RepID=UPI003EE25275